MARMLDLMRQSAVPANIMRTAARGALDLPPAEMIEILVYLAGHPIFGEQAAMTLAGWDEASSAALCADPEAPPDVLEYFLAPQNRRPRLLPALLENPAVAEDRMVEVASTARGEGLPAVLGSARVMACEAALRALAANPNLDIPQLDKVGAALSALPAQPAFGQPPAPKVAVAAAAAVPTPEPAPAPPASVPAEAAPAQAEPEPAAAIADEPAPHADAVPESPPEEDVELGEEQQRFLAEHAAEIAAAEGKPFELVAGLAMEDTAVVEPETAAAVPEGTGAAAGSAGVAVLAMQKSADASAQRESTLQKIARLTVGERVQLAMKGNKDERFVLIRDGNKVVSAAVLESPKVTDSEVENFATMKNVQEGVLRGIAGKRKFMKNYNVVRALVNNPRCPLDLALALVKNLMAPDLNALSKNKNVSETLRKIAFKNFKEKTTKK